MAAEVIHEIRRQIPEFSQPLSGKFGADIQRGVETALAEFVDRVDEGGVRELDAEHLSVYRALGRGELLAGRSLDALQASYRLGARVAWRRYVRVARRLSVGTEGVAQLAEAAFTHIDEIAAESVAAYAEAQAEAADTLGRRRHRLLTLLVSPDPPPPEPLRQAAAEANWPLPREVAAVALTPHHATPPPPTPAEPPPPPSTTPVRTSPGSLPTPPVRTSQGSPPGAPTSPHSTTPDPAHPGPAPPAPTDPHRSGGPPTPPPPLLPPPPPPYPGTPTRLMGRARRLPAPVLADLDGPAPYLLVPDPERHLVDPRVQRLLQDRAGTVGPTVPLAQAADSLRWARTLHTHPRQPPHPGPTGPTESTTPADPADPGDRLTDLLLLADPALVRLMAARRLAPLDTLTPKQRDRLSRTLLAHLQSPHGTAPELAARLSIHPQTARQRLHRLQHLFGGQLTDPEARFEMEAALRAALL
ncbi:helix-turn-helix domain-containing protein [Streptomyces sp. NPDC059009]|uniref:helix-turn-helix domain-containing protein n=1 Tax=Streptomyces sp. NPDC059009 TaxID=3346694 RepID=UPI0036A719E8